MEVCCSMIYALPKWSPFIWRVQIWNFSELSAQQGSFHSKWNEMFKYLQCEQTARSNRKLNWISRAKVVQLHPWCGFDFFRLFVLPFNRELHASVCTRERGSTATILLLLVLLLFVFVDSFATIIMWIKTHNQNVQFRRLTMRAPLAKTQIVWRFSATNCSCLFSYLALLILGIFALCFLYINLCIYYTHLFSLSTAAVRFFSVCGIPFGRLF